MTTHQPERKLLESLIAAKVTSVDRVPGGRNSRIFCVAAGDDQRYAVKQYHHDGFDNRDRLGVEFKALTFLWKNNVRCIPRPVSMDAEHRLAAFEFIAGDRLSGDLITEADVDQLVTFVMRLRNLCSAPGSHSIPPASDACFSGQQLAARINQRLERFSPAEYRQPYCQPLDRFLNQRFRPVFDRCRREAANYLDKAGLSFTEVIPSALLTLSPSDFGFHNALKRPNGSLVILDLEYFGWDDPAKLVNDFMIHPATDLPRKLRQHFQEKVQAVFSDHHLLGQRIEGLRQLFCLNWCLILLNEFLPEDAERRRFATGKDPRLSSVQMGQLKKAESLLDTVCAIPSAPHKGQMP